MPLVCGYCPVSRLARLGEHCGAVQCICWNWMPSAASASSRGVATPAP